MRVDIYDPTSYIYPLCSEHNQSGTEIMEVLGIGLAIGRPLIKMRPARRPPPYARSSEQTRSLKAIILGQGQLWLLGKEADIVVFIISQYQPPE